MYLSLPVALPVKTNTVILLWGGALGPPPPPPRPTFKMLMGNPAVYGTGYCVQISDNFAIFYHVFHNHFNLL